MNDKITKLPAGHFNKLLKEAGLKKSSVENGLPVDGETVNLNKRTMSKLNNGEDVQQASLEKLRKLLKKEKVSDLLPTTVDEAEIFHVEFDPFTIANDFLKAIEIPGEQFHHITWGLESYPVEFRILIDKLTQDQIASIEKLDMAMEERKEEDKLMFSDLPDSERTSLKTQLHIIKKRQSFSDLFEEMEQQGMKVLFAEGKVFKRVYQRIVEAAGNEKLDAKFRKSSSLMNKRVFKKLEFHDDIIRLAAIVPSRIKQARFYIRNDKTPLEKDVRKEPEKYFTEDENSKVVYVDCRTETPKGVRDMTLRLEKDGTTPNEYHLELEARF